MLRHYTFLFLAMKRFARGSEWRGEKGLAVSMLILLFIIQEQLGLHASRDVMPWIILVEAVIILIVNERTLFKNDRYKEHEAEWLELSSLCKILYLLIAFGGFVILIAWALIVTPRGQPPLAQPLPESPMLPWK